MIKVLNVTHSLDPRTGGVTERTVQMSLFLVKNGIECSILTTDHGLTQERIKALVGINVIALPCLFKRFYVPTFSHKHLEDIIKSVDIIHLTNHWTFLNALIYQKARKLKKPYVICPAGALPIYGRSKIIKRLYNFIIGKNIIRHAAACIAIAPNEADHFKKYGVGVDKICFIPNGINRDDFMIRCKNDFRKKYNLGDHPFILFVGRLNPIKGPDLLLRAFCEVKEKFVDLHLVFVGPDRGMLLELQNMAAQFSMQNRIHFVGYLAGEDKAAAYRDTELLVISSRQEAMSIVVLEAGIFGKPVLITDQCGFNDVSVVNGGIVVPASVEGIKIGLVEILNDAVKLQLMGQNLKQYVEDNFIWEITVNKYTQLYQKILGDRG